MQIVRFRCVVCGRLTVGRKPTGGDGTFYYPARHRGEDGAPCPGNVRQAELVEREEGKG